MSGLLMIRAEPCGLDDRDDHSTRVQESVLPRKRPTTSGEGVPTGSDYVRALTAN